jgi:uncharacterized protein YabN with tetrapyrrole methylase and pyrophosphatase domain
MPGWVLPADLYLVGLGIGGLHRLTQEAEEVLSRAAYIVHLSPLQPSLERLCRQGTVESLQPYYGTDPNAAVVYRRMAERMVEVAGAAREVGRHACFATYGHPHWLVIPSRRAQELAADHGLRVVVVPGVSSFDTLLIDSPVQLDFGAQLLDATRFVKQRLRIDARVPVLLFQVGVFGADTFWPTPEEIGRFEPLVCRLEELYPADHPIHIIMSGWGERFPTCVESVPLGELRSAIHVAHGSTTIVIPALASRPAAQALDGRRK